jgi:37-kD nucleoid-associated bacterial protein
MNIESLQINELVVHSVPQQGDEFEQLVLTAAPIALDEELRRYFEGKIQDSLREDGLQVVADELASEVVRDGVASIAQDRHALVAASRVFAEHLYSVQNRRNPPGLLVAATGTVDDDGDVVAILKLERQRGVHFTIEEVDGHNVVDLEFLRRLTLTDKTRIFKTAVVRVTDADDALTLYGSASDDQRGRDQIGIADFFLATFLGCKLRTNPAKATKDFVSATQRFINDDVSSAERQARYLISMQARLDDQVLDITPRTFATTQLLAQDRPAFLQRVVEQGLDPNAAFQKDTSLVKTAKFQVLFEHGMVLLAAREDMAADRLEIADAANGASVTINDSIKRLDGR